MPFKIVPQRDRKLHGLFKAGEPLVIGRSEAVYEGGAPARRIFLVRRGHVRLTLPPCGNGRERTAAVAGPGELFGTEALVGAARRFYGARGGEVAHVLATDGRAAFRSLRGARHTLPRLVEAAFIDLLRARWPEAGAGPTTAQRLADLLLELAERFGVDQEGGVRIPHWFTHEELADLVGAHRSTVTTLLNEWIYQGILVGDANELVLVRAPELDRLGSGRAGWAAGR